MHVLMALAAWSYRLMWSPVDAFRASGVGGYWWGLRVRGRRVGGRGRSSLPLSGCPKGRLSTLGWPSSMPQYWVGLPDTSTTESKLHAWEQAKGKFDSNNIFVHNLVGQDLGVFLHIMKRGIWKGPPFPNFLRGAGQISKWPDQKLGTFNTVSKSSFS